MREKLKDELSRRFGMDGNGKMENELSIEEFEAWSGAKLENSKSNEYGTTDFTVILIDEKSEDFEIVLEVDKNKITHCYY